MSRYLNLSRDIIGIINKYLLPSKNLKLRKYLNTCLLPYISCIKCDLNDNYVVEDNTGLYMYCKSFKNVKYKYFKNNEFWTLRVKTNL
jgi:hypothetical protein